MGWGAYNKNKKLAKDLFQKLKSSLSDIELEDLVKCRNELFEMILKELEQGK